MAVDWNRYVERALGVRADAEDLWQRYAPARVSFADHVRWATYSLRTTFLVNYDAVLALIGDPLIAYAGEPLLRGALEGWAHLYWIEDGETRGSRRGKRFESKRRSKHCFSNARRKWSTPTTRALCWLMGDAISYHKSVAEARMSLKDPKATRHALKNRNRLRRLHDQSGCPGRDGRNYQDVAPMLALIGRRHKLPWVPALWQLYSGSAHQATPLRLIGSAERSAWDGKLPDWERRGLLVRTVTVFLMAYQHVITLSTDGNVDCLSSFVNGIANGTAVPLMAELNALQIPQRS